MDLVLCVEAWEQALSKAQAAYSSRDLEGFDSQLAHAQEDLRCIQSELSPAQAAAWHEVGALSAVLRSERAEAVGALRAAQAAVPDRRLDPAAVNPFLLSLEEEAERLGASPRQPVEVPPGLELRVDGRVAASRPVEAPALLQLVDPKEGVIWTGALEMGAPLPAFPTPTALVVDPRPVGAAEEPRGRRGPAAAAGLMALGTGGLYLWAAASEQEFRSGELPRSELEGAWSRTRGLTLATGAAGLGTAALTVWAVKAW